MENEKMIIKMLQKITTRMDEMNAELGVVRSEIGEVKSELKAEIGEVKAELKAEISEVKAELKVLNQRFDNLGQMFEHTVQLQQEAVQKIDETLKYQAHKIAEFDREIFTLKHKQ